jgi:CBS-domain-containing membrane protein
VTMAKTVADVMTASPRACRRSDSLVVAAKILWENDCGAVPVVDDGQRVVGMITDRDCLMAAFTRGRKLEDLSVQSAMAHMVFAVRSSETVEAAARRMAEHAVRRLPVLDDHGRLCGMVSLADLAQPKSGLTAASVAQALASVTAPRTQAAQPVASKGAAVVAPTAVAAGPAAIPAAASAAKPSAPVAAPADPAPKKSAGKRK